MGRSLCLRGVEGVLQREEVESCIALGREGQGGRGIDSREGMALRSICRSFDSLGLCEDTGAWGGGREAAAAGEEGKFLE